MYTEWRLSTKLKTQVTVFPFSVETEH